MERVSQYLEDPFSYSHRGGLRGALVPIDAIATNGMIAQAIRDGGTDYLLAIKTSHPSPRAEVAACLPPLNPARPAPIPRTARVLAASGVCAKASPAHLMPARPA